MSLSESNVPPGLQSGLKVYVSGGGENTEWFSFEKKKGYTNAFIICGAKAIHLFFLSYSPYSHVCYRYYSDTRSGDLAKDCELFSLTIHCF
jgi:hypothetical protein